MATTEKNPTAKRHDPQFDPIVATKADVEAWRQHCQWAIEFDWVKPGGFNWPRAVLSLIPEWEKNHGGE